VKRIPTFVVIATMSAALAIADEAPISGTVKSVDLAARTLTVEVASKSKVRVVTIHLKPDAKVVRFTRSAQSGQSSFVEQEVPLTEVKAGWVVSAATKHEGNREVADQIKVVFER
jgi:hypothetical protein